MSDIKLEEAVNGIVEELNQKILSIKAAANSVDGNNKSIEEVVEKATTVLTNASNKVIETAKTISNSEEVIKGIEIVRGKSEQLYNYAISKIEEFRNADIRVKTQEIINNTVEDIKNSEIVHDTKETIQNANEYVLNKVDEIKNSSIAQDAQEVVQNVQEFVSNPDLNKVVNEMKFISNELRDKTISTLKDWLNTEGENKWRK